MFSRIGEAHRRRRARRCTTSRTRAVAASRCAPRGPPRWCGPSSSTSPPLPWKVWYAAPELPLREAPRPAATASTTRSASRCSARPTPTSTSRSSRWPGGFYDRLGLRQRRPAAQLHRRRRVTAAATSTRCEQHFRDHLDELGAERPREGRRATRCGCSTPSDPQDAAVIEAAPRDAPTTSSEAAAAHFERGAGAGSTRSASPSTHRAPAGARPRLLHAHHLRVRRPRRSTRPRTRSAAAAATTAWSRRWAGRRRRASASASASSACCWPATPRACSRRRTSAVDVFVVDTTGGDQAALASRSELRSAGLRADRRFDGRSMKAQMKAADRSGARLALIVGADELAAGTGDRARPARAGGPGAGCPGRDRRPGAAARGPMTSRPIPPSASRPRAADGACAPTTPASCAPATSAGRWRCAAGWPGAASTASTSPSSTCATAPASCSAWSTAPVDLRSEYVVRVTGTVRPRPDGTDNAEPATGEVEVGDCEVEMLAVAEPPPVPARRPGRRRRRERAPALPLPRPAPRAHAAQPAPAGPGQLPPSAHGHGATRASSRSRRRC